MDMTAMEFLSYARLPKYRFRPYDLYEFRYVKPVSESCSRKEMAEACVRSTMTAMSSPPPPLLPPQPPMPSSSSSTTAAVTTNHYSTSINATYADFMQHTASTGTATTTTNTSLISTTAASSSLTTNQTSKVNITQLYPEILTLIFKHLSVRDKGRVAQVCSVWRDAVYRKSIWTGVNAKLHLRRAKPHLFHSLVRRGISRVQVLSLRRTLRDVFGGMPNLQSLSLSGIYSINDTMFTHGIRGNISTLTKLDLSLCKQITDVSLEQIARFLPNLEILELGGCSNITNNGLFLVSLYLRQLRVLNLRSCWQINDNGIASIAGHHDIRANFPIDFSAFGNRMLQSLTLQDCQHLSDESLRFISLGLKQLKQINLSFCISITDRGLKHLAEMTELEELNLRSCDNITDRGISHLSGSETSVPSKLKMLDVSFCDKISDVSLRYIADGMTKLVSLSLSACPISDTGLQSIAKSLLQLETLNIGQCRQVSDQGVLAITDSLKYLTAIDLYGCIKISTVGLERIMSLPRLKTLNLGLWIVR